MNGVCVQLRNKHEEVGRDGANDLFLGTIKCLD